jgi:MFS transporter, OFA family, oxalate/formate antiporter
VKYVILLASVIIQVCLGGIYAWSTLVPELVETVDLTVTQTQVIFGLLFGVFTLSMVLAGRLVEPWGPRVVAGIGGLFFATGYLVASRSDGSFPLMLLGISLLAGIGTGAGYVCALTTCMKWFPDRKGLVTGIAMAGFGAGAVLLSTVAEYLLSSGVHVLTVFHWIGLAYGAAILIAAMALRYPTTEQTVLAQVQTAPLKRLVRDPFFLSLVVGMFCGTFAGMLVIGNLKPMASSFGIPALVATGAIGVFAIGNATGRISWGWISDRSSERMIPVKLAALALPVALLAGVSMPAPFIAVSYAIGFGFGACFVLYAALVAARYGVSSVAAIYPLVFLAYGAAGIVGPSLGGWLYDQTLSYRPAIALACGVVGSGIVGSIWLLRKAKQVHVATRADWSTGVPCCPAHGRRQTADTGPVTRG